ncbi:hypothetical protein BB560_001950 [Smittium megazygosporum]|uniref:Uncharacterized protein n=1 Tax=Smittium megazygosporum TaxID=133381 RepID=A0A2T9ZG61_9FUNG|nr:hypothetical protein BB560_001950 [Smittium megazygosporum]
MNTKLSGILESANTEKSLENSKPEIILTKSLYSYFRYDASLSDCKYLEKMKNADINEKGKKVKDIKCVKESKFKNKESVYTTNEEIYIQEKSRCNIGNLVIKPVKRQLPPISYGSLYSGSRFVGLQSNKAKSFDVSVTLTYVDFATGVINGIFTISGLTSEIKQLSTFFEVEVVGLNEHTFSTNKWGSNATIDCQHWSKFKEFEPYMKHAENKVLEKKVVSKNEEPQYIKDDIESWNLGTELNHIKYKFGSCPNVFMRWKEHFLLPDCKVEKVLGASFAGFYYICYNRIENRIYGYYYHKDSEKFQFIELVHEPKKGFEVFELS